MPKPSAKPRSAVPIGSSRHETVSSKKQSVNLALNTAVREIGSASSCFQELV
ncbi:hypothetical protein D3C78_1978320 [compost metagenome]